MLWDCLFKELGSFLSSIAHMTAPYNSSKVFDIIKLLMILVEWKSGVLVGNYVGKVQKVTVDFNKALILYLDEPPSTSRLFCLE